jgi:hypothetical protein
MILGMALLSNIVLTIENSILMDNIIIQYTNLKNQFPELITRVEDSIYNLLMTEDEIRLTDGLIYRNETVDYTSRRNDSLLKDALILPKKKRIRKNRNPGMIYSYQYLEKLHLTS